MEVATILLLLCFFTTNIVRTEDNVAYTKVELKKKLLNGYDKTASPILFENGNHYEAFYLFLRRIRDLDEVAGSFTIEAVLSILWKDSRLSWNATENKIKVLRFSPDEIWTPSVNVLNRVKPDEKAQNRFLLSFEGWLWWGNPMIFHTSCVPNLKYFPFDSQQCDVEIAAITQDGDAMTLNYTSPSVKRNRYLIMRNFTENPRWKLLNTSAKTEQKTLINGHTISVEIFTISFQRTTPLIALGTMIPGVLSILLVLTTFWIRPGDSIRTGINVTAVLVSSSTLFTLGKILPTTGNSTPIIVEYSATALIITMLCSLHAVIVSVVVRLTRPFPLSYSSILKRFPRWIHFVLAIVPSSAPQVSMDQAFLFSELADNVTSQEQIYSPTDVAGDSSVAIATEALDRNEDITEKNGWLNPIVLLDRISFYVYLIVCGLFILSVLINE